MTHYYDQELDKMLAEIRLRTNHPDSFVATATTAGDFLDHAHADEELVKDLLESEIDSDIAAMGIAMPSEEGILENRKQTKGKAKDARYCFFPDITLAFNKTKYYHLALLLKDLTNLVDMKENVYAQNLARAALLEVNSLDNDFMINLCGARADGLKKYSLDNYRDEIPVQSLLDAAARHLIEIIRGQETDKYSGFHHLGHIAANLIMIETQIRLYHLGE